MRVSISGEEGEIHPPVFAMLHKMRMGCKGVFTRVFQDENPLFIQDLCAEYEVRKLRKTRMIEGRVGKNNIEGLAWSLQVPECICPDYRYLIHLDGPEGILNKFIVHWQHLKGQHTSGSPGGKFIGYAARSGKQVKHIRVLDTELMNQNIKKALFSKIGGRPCFEVYGGTYLFAPEYATDYAHLLPSERIM